MLFNSYAFILLFLPIVICLWWSRWLSTRVRLGVLTAASYVFYGWWDYRFVSLLVVSTVVDYFVGQRIYRSKESRQRAGWLSLSIAVNLGLLGFFKYCGFFAATLNSIVQVVHSGGSIFVPEIVLPIGISFYTFQTMSYSIDIYRGQARPANSLWHFAAYVSLFPQLIAGPIVRYSELDEQLRTIRDRINWNLFARGILFFAAGMAQKVLLADAIAARINPLFADYTAIQLIGSWFAMLGYSVQLYFDFAGYSNMAVGLGLMLGFEFPQNFNSPYKAMNISDFWRRWHMTLSSFLRDYLFIPLGGSRRGTWLTLRNLVIVMFLGGLWHGAGWTFVIWGLYHGLLLAIHSVASKVSIRIPTSLSVTITFLCVVFGWVLFRSSDLAMCAHLFSAMFGMYGCETDWLSAVGDGFAVATLGFLLGVVFFLPNVWQWSLRPSLPMSIVVATVFVICVLRFDAESPFLYFQF